MIVVPSGAVARKHAEKAVVEGSVEAFAGAQTCAQDTAEHEEEDEVEMRMISSADNTKERKD